MGVAKKSPLKAAPLRQAGQSVSDSLDEEVIGIAIYFGFAMYLVVSVALGWVRYFYPGFGKTTPLQWTIAASAMLLWCLWGAWRAWRRAGDKALGRKGEIAVGQFLERFRGAGFQIFHDVPTGKANIDHVLIGTKGVFTIETKTMRKPERGECRVRYTQGELFANGVKLKRNPVSQAKAQAGWMKQFFGEVLMQPAIWPVVAIPGWFVESFDQRAAGLWVVEPKALDSFLANEPDRMKPEDAKAAALALSSYIRAQAAV